MIFKDLKLPSNKSFGMFFSSVFCLISIYFFLKYSYFYSYFFIFLSLLFLFISLLKPEILFFLNKFWMMIGYSLGLIISPLILCIIYFTLFVPIGVIMKIFGRDELNLKENFTKSKWINNKEKVKKLSFKNQF